MLIWMALLPTALAGPGEGHCHGSSLSGLLPEVVEDGDPIPHDAHPLLLANLDPCDDGWLEVLLSTDGEVVQAWEFRELGGSPQPLALDELLVPGTEYILRADLHDAVYEIDPVEVGFPVSDALVEELDPPVMGVAGYSTATEAADGTWTHATSVRVTFDLGPHGLSWARVLDEDGVEVRRLVPEHDPETGDMLVSLWVESGALQESLCLTVVGVDAAGRESAPSDEKCVEFTEYAYDPGCALSGCGQQDPAVALVLLPLVGWRRNTSRG